eukprot:4770224-Amphidinium_carterae.2
MAFVVRDVKNAPLPSSSSSLSHSHFRTELIVSPIARDEKGHLSMFKGQHFVSHKLDSNKSP